MRLLSARWQLSRKRNPYWIPTKEAVRRAIRIASDEPFILGVPVHCAAPGIFSAASYLPPVLLKRGRVRA
jgi:hypothetical protein